jgi:hypothetical protein
LLPRRFDPHGRGGRFAPRGIAKNESIIELEVFDEIAGCFVIGIGLAREADDDVGRQCDSWAGSANFVDQLCVFFLLYKSRCIALRIRFDPD